MESFTEEIKKLAKAEVNTADIDPMHLMHTQMILLVYPGCVHTVEYITNRSRFDSWLNRTQDKIKQIDYFSSYDRSRAYVHVSG